MELAYIHDLKSCARKGLRVRLPSLVQWARSQVVWQRPFKAYIRGSNPLGLTRFDKLGSLLDGRASQPTNPNNKRRKNV